MVGAEDAEVGVACLHAARELLEAALVDRAEGLDLGHRVLLISSQLTSSVVFVEGTSDEVAVRALAARLGRNLEAEDVSVVPIGGAQAIRRVLGSLPDDVRAVGLCDVGEARSFERALGSAFFVCVHDLEDELVRAVGADGVLQVIEAHGELSSFRTYQKQVAHRERPLERQLHGFMHNRKVEYARLLVNALDLTRVPAPWRGLLDAV